MSYTKYAFSIITDPFLETKCTNAPPDPTGVRAFPVSSTQIALVWSKPFGEDYESKITIKKKDGTHPTSKTGPKGFSPILADTFSGLQPSTEYIVSVELSCTTLPGQQSQAVSTTIKTMPAGTFKINIAVRHYNWTTFMSKHSFNYVLLYDKCLSDWQQDLQQIKLRKWRGSLTCFGFGGTLPARSSLEYLFFLYIAQ